MDNEVNQNFCQNIKQDIPAFMRPDKIESDTHEESSGNTNDISTDDEMRKELKKDKDEDAINGKSKEK